ncbi:hypothetical protein JTB14_025930 [Gonioctena quinquepunctata]|nr:hypothetical protein JTB14_025930 [Gonioctena quinquepunctata]
MQEHDRTPKKKQYHQDIEVSSGRVHRYAVIETEEETELTSKNARYALVPVDQLKEVVAPNKSRYEYIQDQQRPMSPPSSQQRRDTSEPQQIRIRYQTTRTTEPKQVEQVPRGNPAATQKLHELLSTPKKTPASQKQVLAPHSGRKVSPPPVSPILKEFQAKPAQRVRAQPSRAQQRLNYALVAQQLGHQDKRHTAIVAPICSSPNQSVYSETTYSKSDSWMNLSMKKGAVQTTLSFAAMMMLLCGGVTSGLCFYMISMMGRQYFLDFGVVAGFTCLVLGMLGFRSRNVYWLPNRNYITGYLVLSFFSLLTCTGLLVLLVKQPRPGTPLADITSGAVCGISVLCLVMAMAGIVSSYCCKYPPPDNRVQHCAEGFSV